MEVISNLFTNKFHMEVVSVCYVTEHWPTVLQWLKDWMNNLEVCSPEMTTILRSGRSVCSTSLYCLKADSSFWYSLFIVLSGSVSIRVLGEFWCVLCLQQFLCFHGGWLCRGDQSLQQGIIRCITFKCNWFIFMDCFYFIINFLECPDIFLQM